MLGTVLLVFAALTLLPSDKLQSRMAPFWKQWCHSITLKDFFSVLKCCFTHGVLTHPVLSLERMEPVSREAPEARPARRSLCGRVAPEQPRPGASARLWGSIPAGLGQHPSRSVAAGEPGSLISYQKSGRVPGKLVLDMAAVGTLKVYHMDHYFSIFSASKS